MKTIKWLVTLVPQQARLIVAVLLIAVSALVGVIVYQYKENRSKDHYYEEKYRFTITTYQNKLDSLNTVVAIEKEKSKQEVIEALNKIIEQQKQALGSQSKVRSDHSKIIQINNNIIQQNSQKIKQLKNE